MLAQIFTAWRNGRADALVSSLLGDSSKGLVLKIAGAALSYVMLAVLSRSMSIDEFGVFAVAFSIAAVMGVVAGLGLPLLLLRDLPRLQEKGARRGLIKFAYLAIFTAFGVLAVPLVVASSLYFAWSPMLLIGLSGLVLGQALADLQSHILRAEGRMAAALAPRDVVWRIAVCVVALMTLANAAQLSAASAIAICAGLLIACLCVQFLSGPAALLASSAEASSYASHKPLRRSAGWMWLSSVCTIAVPNASVVLIGAFLGMAEAGPYFAALKTAQLLNLLFMAGNLASAPMISGAHGRQDVNSVQRIGAIVATVSAVLSCVALVVFVVFGELILLVFGAGFDSAVNILIILATGFVVKAALGPGATTLQMTGNERTATRIILISSAILLAALPVAIMVFGAVGAACITAGTMVLASCWSAYALYNHMGINVTALAYIKRPATADHGV